MPTRARIARQLVNSIVAVCLACSVGGDTNPLAAFDETAQTAKTRQFDFRYEATIHGMPAGKTVRLWLPIPPTSEDQEVQIRDERLPGNARRGREGKYGNEMFYLESQPDSQGTLAATITYRVLRREVLADTRSPRVSGEEASKFLRPDAKVPVGGKSLRLLEDRRLPEDQLQLGRLLYDVVNQHMTYSKQGTGWGQGDADWACDSRFGNCSDFHSLFISLARAQGMPARFEIGFPLPDARGEGEIPGYHCWAKFHPANHGWIPVDISEANKVKEKDPRQVEYYYGNLTENRVTFSVGRDLVLEPPQSGPPLNFFVYPYAESQGKPVPADQIMRRFSYRDVSE